MEPPTGTRILNGARNLAPMHRAIALASASLAAVLGLSVTITRRPSDYDWAMIRAGTFLALRWVAILKGRVDASLAETAMEDGFEIASVRFTGLIREAPGAQPEAFDEIWHVRRKASDPKAAWLIMGIQQVG